MKTGFLNSPDDVQWLKETHLRGVPLSGAYASFASFVLQGNEDAPHAVNLYVSAEPNFTDNYLRVEFKEAPVYCEIGEYDGRADQPVSLARAVVPVLGYYRGWKISYDASRPVTGTWRAERFGVGMCAGERSLLLRMVDTRAAEQGE